MDVLNTNEEMDLCSQELFIKTYISEVGFHYIKIKDNKNIPVIYNLYKNGVLSEEIDDENGEIYNYYGMYYSILHALLVFIYKTSDTTIVLEHNQKQQCNGQPELQCNPPVSGLKIHVLVSSKSSHDSESKCKKENKNVCKLLNAIKQHNLSYTEKDCYDSEQNIKIQYIFRDKLIKYYSMSILNGNENIHALTNLGNYFHKQGNHETATFYWLKAVNKTLPKEMQGTICYGPSTNNVAIVEMSQPNKSHKTQYDKIKSYYSDAADKGNTIAMINLAFLYHNMEKNYDMAEKYLLLAAKKEDPKIMNILNMLYNKFKYYDNMQPQYPHFIGVIEKHYNASKKNMNILLNNLDNDNKKRKLNQTI